MALPQSLLWDDGCPPRSLGPFGEELKGGLMEFSIHIVCRECRTPLEPVYITVSSAGAPAPTPEVAIVWARMKFHAAECRVLHPDGPAGLAAIIGQWPGDETEEEVQRGVM